MKKLTLTLTLTICICAIMTTLGCDTDIRPSAFIDMVNDPSDIDALSSCLSAEPTIEGNDIVFRANTQCLVDLSNSRIPDELTIETISRTPVLYMDKQLTFSAAVKKITQWGDPPKINAIELYTNNPDVRFTIQTRDIDIGIPIEEHATYLWTVRIYEIGRHADRGNLWSVNAQFILSANNQIEYQPQRVGW